MCGLSIRGSLERHDPPVCIAVITLLQCWIWPDDDFLSKRDNLTNQAGEFALIRLDVVSMGHINANMIPPDIEGLQPPLGYCRPHMAENI